MATMQELEAALVKADAAGNADDARAFATEIRRMRQMSSQPTPQPEPVQSALPASRFDQFMAGVGKSVADNATGVAQLLSSEYAPLAIGIPGLITRNIGRAGARQAADKVAAESKERDRELLESGWGLAGNITGAVAQTAVPGSTIARGTSVGQALLPATIRGNALLGAAEGLIRPTSGDDSRIQNALIGGGAGAAGAGALKAVGKGVNSLAALARGGASGADRGAAEVLMREAADPSNLRRVMPSQVPGVQRSLAEETLDPGIARLERTVRSTGGQFDALDRSNNLARIRALETFAEDAPALAAAKATREQVSGPLRRQAMEDQGVDVGAIRDVLSKQLEATATRPSVRSALLDVKSSLDQAGDDVFSLYGTRKYIDDLMSGKAGSDKSYARAAKAELMHLKGVLDEKIAKASPSFSEYLEKYQDLSVPINRMQIGQSLTSSSSGGAVLDPTTGVQVLTPAQFSKASRSLDQVAAKATGFKQARAQDILRPGDIGIIKSIQDDLERQAFRTTAGSGGNSQTFERLGVQDRIANRAGREAIGAVPGGRYVRDILDALDRSRNDQLKERLAYLVANPDEARRVIGSLSPAGKQIVTKALTQIGGAAGISTGLMATGGGDPLEIEIVGGTRESSSAQGR